MTMIDLFQTRQKSTNNFIIMISILQALLKVARLDFLGLIPPKFEH